MSRPGRFALVGVLLLPSAVVFGPLAGRWISPDGRQAVLAVAVNQPGLIVNTVVYGALTALAATLLGWGLAHLQHGIAAQAVGGCDTAPRHAIGARDGQAGFPLLHDVSAPARHDSAVSPGLHRLPARCLCRLTGGLLNGDAGGPGGRLRWLRRGAGRKQQGGKKDRKAAHAPALEDRGAGGNPVRFMLLCGKRVGGFYSLAPRLRETHVSIN